MVVPIPALNKAEVEREPFPYLLHNHAHHPPPSHHHLLLHRLAAGESEGVDSGGGRWSDEEDWIGTPRIWGRHQLSGEGELLQV